MFNSFTIFKIPFAPGLLFLLAGTYTLAPAKEFNEKFLISFSNRFPKTSIIWPFSHIDPLNGFVFCLHGPPKINWEPSGPNPGEGNKIWDHNFPLKTRTALRYLCLKLSFLKDEYNIFV